MRSCGKVALNYTPVCVEYYHYPFFFFFSYPGAEVESSSHPGTGPGGGRDSMCSGDDDWTVAEVVLVLPAPSLSSQATHGHVGTMKCKVCARLAKPPLTRARIVDHHRAYTGDASSLGRWIWGSSTLRSSEYLKTHPNANTFTNIRQSFIEVWLAFPLLLFLCSKGLLHLSP